MEKQLLYVQNKPIYLENWLKSDILYTKDWNDMNGSNCQIEYFYVKISNKNDILIREYLILRTVFCKYSYSTNAKKHPFINIKKQQVCISER